MMTHPVSPEDPLLNTADVGGSGEPSLSKLSEYFKEGLEARSAGEAISANPYVPGTSACKEWKAGWSATCDLDEDRT